MTTAIILNNSLSKAFFCTFPHLRPIFNELKDLNATLGKIESIAFASFPSLRKAAGNRDIKAERARIIKNIQNSPYSEKTIESWLKLTAEKIDQAKKGFLFPHERKQLDLLEQQHLALSYRSGAISKGYNREKGEALADEVEPIIRLYISHPKIFPGRYSPAQQQRAALSEKERSQLVHACTRYPELFRRFIARHSASPKPSDEWTENFVKWCLRSDCSVGVFVKMPIERAALSRLHLDKRSGSVDGKKGIRFSDVGLFGCFRRTLCMKMDDIMQPIQGEFKKRVITLKNLIHPETAGLTISIHEIFAAFGKKTSIYGNVDYLAGGVRNWNSIELGSYNGKTKKIDKVAVESFLEELKTKAPMAILTAEEVRLRYNLAADPSLNTGQWALGLRASRLKPTLNILEAHGYAEVVQRDNDRYYVFPLGVQPTDLPQKSLAKLLYLTATNKAGLHYPDESFFLKQRQQTGILFPLSKEEETRLHSAVSDMQRSSAEGSLLFQFSGTNCSFHIQKLFDYVIAAPFYEKIEAVASRAFARGNFIINLIDRINFHKAFEGLNHDLLNTISDKLINHLWEEKNLEDIKEIAHLCHQLLIRSFQQELPIDLSKITLDNSACKDLLKMLVCETIEAVRFYRMDLFKIETDQPILSSLNKIIELAPWRWMKQVLMNTILLLFGSWRWIVVRKGADPRNRSSGVLHVSSVAANPLIQEGYLNHPAALWEWHGRRQERFSKLQRALRLLQTN